MTLDELIAEEKKCRKAGKWLMMDRTITNDHGHEVRVRIKQYGFYSQILKVGDSEVDHASGHSINKVTALHAHIRATINAVGRPEAGPAHQATPNSETE